MSTIDKKLKTIFIGTVLWLLVLSFVGLCLYLGDQRRQAEREIIYLKARAMAEQQQKERTREWQKRRKEQELRAQYNKGRVVDISRPATPAAAPKQENAAAQ